MRRFRAESDKELAVIRDALHDAWFDAEQIQFDAAAGQVTMPFERQVIVPKSGGRRAGLFNNVIRRSILCYLIVKHVTEFMVNDSEQVRFYDLSDLRFVRDELKLETGVPIKLTIKINQPWVELEETDRVLEEREGRRIGFDLLSRPSKHFGK